MNLGVNQTLRQRGVDGRILLTFLLRRDSKGVTRLTVTRWRNNTAVRLPVAITAAARPRPEQPVGVREEHGRAVIGPVREVGIDPDAQVAAITDENRHEAVESGPAVGQEAG